jgi:hypothetical protein
MEHLQRTAAQSISLGLGSTKKGSVSPLLSFCLHFFSVRSERILPKEVSKFRSYFKNFVPGGEHATLNQSCCSNSPRITTNLVQSYGVRLSFHLHYFSPPSEHFLPKEISQIFAPIPGGGHATSRAELLVLSMKAHLSISTPAFSRATSLKM